MNMDFKKALEGAVSFPGSRPPDNAEEIGCMEVGATTFILYQGKAGRYYYSTPQGLAFAREMEEAQKRRKKGSRTRAKRKSADALGGTSAQATQWP